jgi:hypothetical protein
MLIPFSMIFVLTACGGDRRETGSGRDLGYVDLANADAGCTGDLAGTALQICGGPDASFDPKTCACAGDP